MARILDRASIGERGKVQQAKVNANSFFSGMVDDFLLYRTGKNDIPVIRFSLDRAGFHLAYWWASFLALGELDFEGANFGEAHPVICGERKARLWESEGLIAPVAVKPGIARRFSFSDPPEERLVRLVHTSEHILQH